MGGLMSEKREPKRVKTRYVSGEEFARYIDAKGIDATCLRCHSTSWSLHDTSYMLGTGVLTVPTKGPLDISEAGYIPQVALSCNECGTMWFLSRGYVQEWLDSNPAEPNDD